MVESSTQTLFGLSPKRYGVTSLIASCLAFVSWPLMVVLGFLMVYIAILLAVVAVVSGLLGVGAGIYYKAWPAVVMGGIGMGLTGVGVSVVVSALSSF